MLSSRRMFLKSSSWLLSIAVLVILHVFTWTLCQVNAAEWVNRPVPPAENESGHAAQTGVVWYRVFLEVPQKLVVPMEDPKDLWRESMTLALQDVRGSFQVFLNGKKMIEGDSVDGGAPVRFKIAKDILKEKVYNVLAIRLQGDAAKHGLRHAPVFGGYLDEARLTSGWQVFEGDVEEKDLQPVQEKPAYAVYTPQDWKPANTVLQAPKEPVRGKQVPPKEALTKLSTPEDLVVESLLHEPAVAQPTHVSYDEKGRMWVSQYRQYPYPAGLKMISRDAYYRSKYDRVPPAPPYHDKGRDIISVHEDRDGDGIYEHQKNVLTGLNMANAALRGHGGIWVMHTPYLLFYPDANGDDVPDGDPQVRISGFGLEDTHSVANGLTWGPDGWLYGAQGSTVISHVSLPEDKPGSKTRYLEGCCVWRYHPEKRIFEVFADGSGNTFGLHFDNEGRLFSGHNGGNTRGWHHVQEGDYLKQGTQPDKFGPPTNPYAFGSMPSMEATHPIPRFSHNIIMIEGSAMPKAWRGQLLGADPLHQNLVAAKREPKGSTFITTDTGKPVQADDMTFRPVYLINAPDGSVTIADFREEYIAHGQNYQGQIDPDSGRVYRLRGNNETLEKDVNLAAKSNAELVRLLNHPNHWHRHTAVRVLGERGDKSVVPELLKLLEPSHRETHPALEALWALYQLQALDEKLALETLRHPAPMVRAWTIRLMGDERNLSESFLKAVAQMVEQEANAEVRLQVISTARRLSDVQALTLVTAVLKRNAEEDRKDPFIPLMAWFILEAHCEKNSEAVLAVFQDHPQLWSLPLVREHLTPKLMRRFAAEGTRQGLLICARLLNLAPEEADKQALVAGFEEAFKGLAMPPLPDELAQALASLGKGSMMLRIRQGDVEAKQIALKLLADPKGDKSQRLLYARVFGEVSEAEAVPVLLQVGVTKDHPADLRKVAIGSLSRYEDAAIGVELAKELPELPRELQEAAINLLASRPSWAMQLLGAVEQQKLPRELLHNDLLARMRLYDQQDLKDKLVSLFPQTHGKPVAANVMARINEIRTILSKAPGDPYAGEAIYMERCGTCHKLFHKGGSVGPNLTSYQRDDLGTMLISIIDPNAEIREGYVNQLVTTKDGRVLSGFLADQDANVIVLRGFDGNDITIPRQEVANMQGVGASLMPPGLLEGISDEQLRNLFAYLRISQPITK